MGRLPLPERCVLNKEKARELGIQTGFSVQSCEHHQNSLAEGAWKISGRVTGVGLLIFPQLFLMHPVQNEEEESFLLLVGSHL